MMTARELMRTCEKIAREYNTCYVWGGCGMPVTERTLADKLAQYPEQNRTYCAQARKYLDKDFWMFDCVCLIKSVLWQWSGNRNAYYGGAVYASNGVPDVSADGMIGRCKSVSTDFSKITPGEALWLPGHIGVYLGSGLAAECTPAFAGGVQITNVWNVGGSAYPGRKWQKHGLLPWVDYKAEKQEVWQDGQQKNPMAKIVVNGTEYPIERILQDGRNYFQIRPLVDILNQEGLRIAVGNVGSTAVLTFDAPQYDEDGKIVKT